MGRVVTTDPRTDVEWQDAVDVAECLLALDAARLYGLIIGGPAVDVERCVAILDRGSARGIIPRPDAIEQGVAALLRVGGPNDQDADE